MILKPPVNFNPNRAITDLTTGHPLLQERWPPLHDELETLLQGRVRVIEVYRYNQRQQWLYGQGRNKAECKAAGVPENYARAGNRVTNAASSLTSAHGWTREVRKGVYVPAAAALDVVPLGNDGLPWTKDDPWLEFIDMVKDLVPLYGLHHFSKPGKQPWDKPHLQLVEWSDTTHTVKGG